MKAGAEEPVSEITIKFEGPLLEFTRITYWKQPRNVIAQYETKSAATNNDIIQGWLAVARFYTIVLRA